MPQPVARQHFHLPLSRELGIAVGGIGEQSLPLPWQLWAGGGLSLDGGRRAAHHTRGESGLRRDQTGSSRARVAALPTSAMRARDVSSALARPPIAPPRRMTWVMIAMAMASGQATGEDRGTRPNRAKQKLRTRLAATARPPPLPMADGSADGALLLHTWRITTEIWPFGPDRAPETGYDARIAIAAHAYFGPEPRRNKHNHNNVAGCNAIKR